VVESEGEWSPGLILKRDADRYYVHHVGQDMSDNEWVTADRLRFPASSVDPGGAPWDWSGSSGFLGAKHLCKQAKPAPVNTEL
jgi:hypothetical protein